MHPGLSKEQYGLKEVYVFELEAMALRTKEEQVYSEISRFPSMTRDLAIVVERSVTAQSIVDVMTEAAGPLLQTIELFDVYTVRTSERMKNHSLSPSVIKTKNGR